uniref:ATP synthase F0 subunit 8 n=1 Tax=Dendrobaena veneta TaxID=332521 RepID=UPI002551F104|nr:ATP synthase F0 subunit 8 [Dendrobaena veneta]WGU49267.1 ATP synthase F0 subunit 8 [Dendrobaena veneta]
MPHLSPMSWIISIILFWTSLSMLTSTLWWTSTPQFTSTNNNKATQNKNNSWSWT